MRQAFFPLQDSRTLILQNFRAHNFAAGGVRNVFKIRSKLEFRVEGYAFMPFEQIVQTADQKAAITKIQMMYFSPEPPGSYFTRLLGR
jgi:NTE family protein